MFKSRSRHFQYFSIEEYRLNFNLIKLLKTIMFNSLSTVLDPKKSKAKYPEARELLFEDNLRHAEKY